MLDNYSCPIALESREVITLSHGSGGKQTSLLIEQIFLPAFANKYLNMLHDSVELDLFPDQIIFTTDSYVVQPLFFPGGDIGKLAVVGTLNDLVMSGAKPRYLSCSFIIEEGFLQEDLKRIVQSMKEAAEEEGVEIVTGDTKVIERQTGTNIFINTSGIGVKVANYSINPRQIQEGDAIVLSGDIGRHGMAIMAAREGLEFVSPLISDCCCLSSMVHELMNHGISIHCLRDLTRGGLGTALVELSEASGMDFAVEEELIPVSESVNSACEILGFDPLYVANEGRFIAFIPKSQAAQTIKILQTFQEGRQATLIGYVVSQSVSPCILLKNAFGTGRYLYKLVGEQLPRIC